MGKRKIGGVIVSDFNHTNYGSCLQAYATLQIVKGFGYDLTFIKYKKTTFNMGLAQNSTRINA